MLSVLWIVIGVVVFSATVSAVGSDNLGEYIWYLWTTFVPSKASSNVKQLREIQREAIAVSTERSNTSSQDEFAKWAKLNRKVDKLRGEIEKLNAAISTQRAFFKSQVRRLIWISTTGMKIFVRIKYRKAAVFWLPKGMFPYWVEWMLSLTSAPMGSVSVSAWFMITDYAIKGAVAFAITKTAEMTIAKRKLAVPAAKVSDKKTGPEKKVPRQEKKTQ
ncbi:CHD5-like protein-domain-containing protein [Lipomyces tetrasporus]|uniref:Golgi to ER traffic protein 1 n=1 Tax=Lipomyces tetrasporus TaxID=54092 RepID=A0AAD7QMN7_9ASCO|nr:CHD5-like protein-domain-containing protein [Lipomyces tetrasporus]KAJ8096722.1 CHD5-like protein-domain-containing protein [Lipomyces tetrasporus]